MVHRLQRLALMIALCLLASPVALPAQPKQPPKFIGEVEREELRAGLRTLRADLDRAAKALATEPDLQKYLPDVQVLENVVRGELEGGPIEEGALRTLRFVLKQGQERATQLCEGKTPWRHQSGKVIRGFRSRLDDSVQPYVINVPASWEPAAARPRPVFVELPHAGLVTELKLIEAGLYQGNGFADDNSFHIRAYARGYNAAKFAGEVCVFEQLAHATAQYNLDPRRVAVHGFSMGGSCTWHLTAHHPDRWVASSPGAGFADTEHFVRIWDWKEQPPAWQKTLFHCYNATDVASNLFNCPTFAYVGENDGHKFSHDAMGRATARDGVFLRRAIGPDTGHNYHKDSRKEVADWFGPLVAAGLPEFRPRVRYSTYTLRYDRCAWVKLDRLEKHWDRADVNAEVRGNVIEVTTANVAAFTIDTTPMKYLTTESPVQVIVDGYRLPAVDSKMPASLHLVKRPPAKDKKSFTWEFSTGTVAGLNKVHGLTGPIDDAFMDRFLFVRPTGKPAHERVGAWVEAERENAKKIWRQIYRGQVLEKADADVTEEDLADCNLVLWGDPGSNKLITRILAKLPIGWDATELHLGEAKYAADAHVPVMIFPNPLNPKRYVVINSGPTQRKGHTKTSALTTPKLPDFAVIDVRTAPNDEAPGKVVVAGFFDEHWAFPAVN